MPRDVWLVFRHAVEPSLRNPAVLLLGLFQPLLYLVLLGPLLVGMGLPGASADASWAVFLPGVLLMLAVFGCGFAGFALIPDHRAGVLERMRASPLSRPALLLGRVLREVAVVLVQALLLVGLAALVFGLRVPVPALLLGLPLLALLGTALAAVSYTLALRVTNEYEFAPLIQNTSMPLLLLSGFLVPMEAGPQWLRVVSRLNPMTYVLDAERSLFVGGQLGPVVPFGFALAVILAVLALIWGTRTFRHLGA